MNKTSTNGIRIATNIKLTPDEGELRVDYLGSPAEMKTRDLFRTFTAADAIVLKLPSKRQASLAAAAKVYSPKTRLVYYDVNIPAPSPNTWVQLRKRIALRLIRQADLILTLHADTREYARLLRVPSDRLHYVGFKSNSWEDTATVQRGWETRDVGGYVLACGRSYRDFATFSEAMGEAGVPARILLTQGSLEAEGSIPPTEPVPDNLELVQHDGTRSGWLEALLGARIVVVPLRGDVIQPAGISVYLEAMNLSRPVVVTDGPSTRSMIDDSMAGVVPAGDKAAMAQEVLRLWQDDELRKRRIEAAREYVATLGGVHRMSQKILGATTSLVQAYR